ncbi:unnamed protein product, partial [Amoebophrya sp. A120]|eukprot:GSA120T00005215001.1
MTDLLAQPSRVAAGPSSTSFVGRDQSEETSTRSNKKSQQKQKGNKAKNDQGTTARLVARSPARLTRVLFGGTSTELNEMQPDLTNTKSADDANLKGGRAGRMQFTVEEEEEHNSYGVGGGEERTSKSKSAVSAPNTDLRRRLRALRKRYRKLERACEYYRKRLRKLEGGQEISDADEDEFPVAQRVSFDKHGARFEPCAQVEQASLQMKVHSDDGGVGAQLEDPLPASDDFDAGPAVKTMRTTVVKHMSSTRTLDSPRISNLRAGPGLSSFLQSPEQGDRNSLIPG